MDTRTPLARWLQDEVERLVEEHGVPAASVAVARGAQVVTAAAGVLSTATGLAATPDSIFQIGSVTKLWTATLVMQLVEEGLADLDVPVVTYLPTFSTARESMSRHITLRHLLSHTAGFEGDVFVDTGEGHDALGKLVDLLAGVRQVSAPGELYSYSNAGYCVAGRVAEVLRGKPFDTLVRTHIAEPLAMTSIATSAAEAIVRRPAVGHLRGLDGTLRPTQTWSLVPSNAAAGATLCMTASDLTRFAQMHLAGGVTPWGEQVLSRIAVAQMQVPHVQMPYLGHGPDSRGLGWGIFDIDGIAVLGHNGVTVGQFAFLRIIPSADVTLAVLTNGGDADALHQHLLKRLLGEVTGTATTPTRPHRAPRGARGPVARDDLALEQFTGSYESGIARFEVSVAGTGRLAVNCTPLGVATSIGERPTAFELEPIDESTFVLAGTAEGADLVEAHVFGPAAADGFARYVYNGRIHDRR